MPLVKIKNHLTQGARYVHHVGGQAVLRPGESKELEFTADQLLNFPDGVGVDLGSAASRLGTEAAAGDAPPDFSKTSDDALREFIEKRDGKAPHKNLNRDKLIELASANPSSDAQARARSTEKSEQQKTAEAEAAEKARLTKG